MPRVTSVGRAAQPPRQNIEAERSVFSRVAPRNLHLSRRRHARRFSILANGLRRLQFSFCIREIQFVNWLGLHRMRKAAHRADGLTG